MSKPRKPAAAAVSDLEKGVVLARVDIDVPIERVFSALTTEELSQWWGAPELYKITGHTMDLRAGGKWRSDGVGADGVPFHVEGEVLAVEAPRLLTQTWKASWEPGPASTVAYRLEPTATGTRVTVRHSGFTNPQACDSHAQGWERVFGWLGAHLTPADTDQVFFIRLLAPRPTFMKDMTPEEGAVMQAHASYWRGKLAEGAALIFGPVADPKGGWGLGVVKAKDEAAVRAFEAGDPAIVSGRGFRYEILPMVRAVY